MEYPKLVTVLLFYFLTSFMVFSEIFVPFEESGPSVLSHGPRESNLISITIDDGWEPNWELINFLKEEDVVITAFLVGKIIPLNIKWIEALHETGAELCNHGYSHKLLDRMESDLITEELRRTNELIESITGEAVNYLRPSGGFVSSELLEIAERESLQIVLWDSDLMGYYSESTVEEQFENLKSSLEGGNIILSHFDPDSNILEVLELFVPYARELGYRFVTLSELLQENN